MTVRRRVATGLAAVAAGAKKPSSAREPVVRAHPAPAVPDIGRIAGSDTGRSGSGLAGPTRNLACRAGIR